MAIKINFDSASRPEVPTFMLSEKNGDHVGVLSTISQIHVIGNLNSFSEFSFSILIPPNFSYSNACLFYYILKYFFVKHFFYFFNGS